MQTETDAGVEVIHVRLPKELVKRIDHLAVDEDLYRQDTIKKLLTIALGVVSEHDGRLPNPGAPA